MVFHLFQRLAKALEVDDLPGSQELDDVIHIRVIREPQNVVIGNTGFLFCGQILRQICNYIALHCHRCGVPGKAGGCCGINAGGVIYKVGVKSRCLDVLFR